MTAIDPGTTENGEECVVYLTGELGALLAQQLERAEVPRPVAMKPIGHKTESVYRRYAIVNDADPQRPPESTRARFRVHQARWPLTSSR